MGAQASSPACSEKCGRNARVPGEVGGFAITSEKFDYIFVIDPHDFSVDALKKLREKLNSHGRLLLAYENPFALRYWSGKSSPVTSLPYSSILGRDGRAGKSEMQSRLRQAGFKPAFFGTRRRGRLRSHVFCNYLNRGINNE